MVLVKRINQDHLHSVIQFELDRTELCKAYKYHISNTSYYIMYIVPGNLTKHTLVLRGSITQGGRATSKLFLNKIPTTSNI